MSSAVLVSESRLKDYSMLMLLHPKTRLSTCKQSLFPCLLSITSNTIPSSKSWLPVKHFSLFCFISMLAVNHFQYYTLFQVLASCKSLSILPFSVIHCQNFTFSMSLLHVKHCHSLALLCQILPILYLPPCTCFCQSLSLYLFCVFVSI